MLFNSFVFLLAFLPITYLIFWALRSASSRYIWLTITGYVFYGYWDARFCLLMAFSTLVSYFAGLGLLYFHTNVHRRLCLIIPISVDLLLLGFFKYTNFILQSVRDLTGYLGQSITTPMYNIILPVGISFYTFHTISYIVDCYRGTIRPTRNLFEFSAYVSLFSQLVAGPIVRFRQIEQDLESLGIADRTRWFSKGVAYFIYGLAEKVIVADTLAVYVDACLTQYHNLSMPGAWITMIGYSCQLYFDFSGYSNMAIGLGLLFGLRIPINFNSPYKALDPSDFWRRWHISLSSCLRDYLYIPLGGNRAGKLATYQNLMLTMLIGGIWHGANWTFIIWGAYHGCLLVLYRKYGIYWDRLPHVMRQIIFYALIVIGWVFFRASDLNMAIHLLSVMFTFVSGNLVHEASFYLMLLGAIIWSMVGPNAQDTFKDYKWKPRHAFIFASAFGVSIAIIAGGRLSPFLYFQF